MSSRWANIAFDVFQVLQYSCSSIRKFENPNKVTFETLCALLSPMCQLPFSVEHSCSCNGYKFILLYIECKEICFKKLRTWDLSYCFYHFTRVGKSWNISITLVGVVFIASVIMMRAALYGCSRSPCEGNSYSISSYHSCVCSLRNHHMLIEPQSHPGSWAPHSADECVAKSQGLHPFLHLITNMCFRVFLISFSSKVWFFGLPFSCKEYLCFLKVHGQFFGFILVSIFLIPFCISSATVFWCLPTTTVLRSCVEYTLAYKHYSIGDSTPPCGDSL